MKNRNRNDYQRAYMKAYRAKQRQKKKVEQMSKQEVDTPSLLVTCPDEEVRAACARLCKMLTAFPNLRPQFTSWADKWADKIRVAREHEAAVKAGKVHASK